MTCPICKKNADPANEDAPFCSERCRTIDLGKWASGDYKISSPILDPDLLEDAAERQQQQQSVIDSESKYWKN
jgi:endogenous inhibitor of DNA gyrase (YacG/DUF329 family)